MGGVDEEWEGSDISLTQDSEYNDEVRVGTGSSHYQVLFLQLVKMKEKRRRGLMRWRRGKLMKGATSHRRRMSAHSQLGRCVI